MKLITLIFALLTLGVQIITAQNTKYQVQVSVDDELKSTSLYLKQLDLWFLPPTIIDSFKLNDGKIFIDDIDTSLENYIQVENYSILIFPDPNKTIEFNFTKDENGKIKYTSSHDSLYKYWSSYQDRHQRNGGYDNEHKNSLKLDFDAYLDDQKNHFDKRSFEVDSVCNSNNFPESFRRYMKTTMKYEHEAKIIDYFEHHFYYATNKESLDYYMVDDDFYKRFTNALTNDNHINLGHYSSFVDSYIDNLYYRAFEHKDSDLKLYNEYQFKFNAAKNTLEGKTRDLALCGILRNNISKISDFDSYRSCGELIQKFDSICVERKFYDHVKAQYEEKALLGLKPEFCLLNNSGDENCLSNWSGKNIVLYFTGSNCIPCKKEQPIIENLASEYPEITFLVVSLEHNTYEYWKKSIKPNTNLSHLYAEGGWSSDQLSEFNLRSIPRFILVNKQGEIVNGNASYPSNNLKKDLEKYFER